MPVWLIAASVLCFAGLGTIAHGSGTLRGDEYLLTLVQRAPSTPWKTIADVGNLLGETVTFPIVLIALGLYSLWNKSSHLVAFCLSLLGFRLLGMFLKRLFDSPRPDSSVAELRGIFEGHGFPSGHAQTATVVAAATTIVLFHLAPGTTLTRAIVVLIWIWAATCGFARIWFGAHWPSDVLGGFLIAIVFTGTSTRIASTLGPRFSNSRS